MFWTAVRWACLLWAAYMIGSLPTAYILGRWRRGVDIRTLGDGNVGAANAFRMLGRPVGFAVAVADVGKGALAAFVARHLGDETVAPMMAGAVAVAGHNWPFLLHFRGGRGAAPALGVLVFILPMAVLPLSLLVPIVLVRTRSVNLALSFVFIPLPLVAWLTGASYPQMGYCGALFALVAVTYLLRMKRSPSLSRLRDQAGRG